MPKQKSGWKLGKNGEPYYHTVEADIQKNFERRLEQARIPYISGIQYRCRVCHTINNSHLGGACDVLILKSGVELKQKTGRLRTSQKTFQLKWPELKIFVPKGPDEANGLIEHLTRDKQ